MVSTGRPAADDFYVVVAMFKLCAVFRGEETTHALDQPLKRFNIELIAAAKRMDDLRLGKAFFFVPDVVGKLDILDDGAVLVLFCFRWKWKIPQFKLTSTRFVSL